MEKFVDEEFEDMKRSSSGEYAHLRLGLPRALLGHLASSGAEERCVSYEGVWRASGLRVGDREVFFRSREEVAIFWGLMRGFHRALEAGDLCRAAALEEAVIELMRAPRLFTKFEISSSPDFNVPDFEIDGELKRGGDFEDGCFVGDLLRLTDPAQFSAVIPKCSAAAASIAREYGTHEGFMTRFFKRLIYDELLFEIDTSAEASPEAEAAVAPEAAAEAAPDAEAEAPNAAEAAVGAEAAAVADVPAGVFMGGDV